MRVNHRMIGMAIFAAALASPVAMAGCASRGPYDSYGQEYYGWNAGEDRYYRRWERETHRDHMNFNRRSPDEQRAYWGWRHR
jgi:hypothetical protein